MSLQIQLTENKIKTNNYNNKAKKKNREKIRENFKIMSFLMQLLIIYTQVVCSICFHSIFVVQILGYKLKIQHTWSINYHWTKNGAFLKNLPKNYRTMTVAVCEGHRVKVWSNHKREQVRGIVCVRFCEE